MKNAMKVLHSLPFICFWLLLGANAIAVTPAELAELLADDGADLDLFGDFVALDGDTALVGARKDDDKGTDSGSVYVFTFDGVNWNQTQKLTASDGVASDQFGMSMALDGNTAIISAPDGANGGFAYVFTFNGTSWTEQQKLTPSDGASFDHFGGTASLAAAVALDGDTAIIGSSGHDDNAPNSGSAYVFTFDGTSWTEQQELTASDAGAGDGFGIAVALDGDTAIIGSLGDDDESSDSGAAYVFTFNGTSWTEQQKLTASDAQVADQFGARIALDGDTALIVARLDDDIGFQGGSAYVFTHDGMSWNEQQKLLGDFISFGHFGSFGLALDGDRALIGQSDNFAGSRSGTAYLFVRSGGTWIREAKFAASDTDAGDHFNRTAISGNTALIGAIRHDHPGVPTGLCGVQPCGTGAAYVFSLLEDDEGPITSNVVANPNPVAINTAITLTANVDDTTTGGSDIASADLTIDGGAGVGMAAQDGDFDEVVEDVTATVPAFAEAGVHYLCVSGTDAAGNKGEEDCTFLAVYDPDDGFVTGGGWINSPVGAYTADQILTGKANFGFVSKYKKGATIPTGNTEFQFKAGDLNFHSGSYEWLVIAGHQAKYKGTGTINGSGNYGFMLSAVDSKLTPSTDVDLFRIKIWDKDNGDTVVYDNEIGAPDHADATTAIGGGSIVIHKK